MLESELEAVNEAYSDAVRSMMNLDNVGWNLYSGIDVKEGFDLEQLKGVSEKLREWTDTNPLLYNGWEKRCSYMFGTGYTVGTTGSSDKVSARIQALIDSKRNQDAVFSEQALAINERSRFTDGAVFLIWNKTKQYFQRVPIVKIDDVATDPDNVEIKWFYHLNYTRQVLRASDGQLISEPVKVWYPTDTSLTDRNAPHPLTINGDKVDYNIVILDDIVGEHTGNLWGTPDAFTAAPWALAYSSYLRDGTKVLASLAEWAWKLSPKSKKATDNAGSRIKTASGEAGGKLVTDMDVQSLPRASAVDLSTGRPLAAQVAAALGISVVLLLSDPGQSGAFGTAQTLTDPSLRSLLNRQKVNTKFMKRCLALMGLKSPDVIWEKMNPDADYREQQTLVAALGSGLFHPDEIRDPMAKLANIQLNHDKEPDGYLLPNNEKSLPLKAIDTDSASTVKTDGTTSLTNGQGKDASAKPSYGANDLRGTGGRDN